MKKHIIIIFLSLSILKSFSQKINSGIVHYESRISKKALNKYLSNKRKKIKNNAVLKSLDKAYLFTGSIKSELNFSNTEGIFKVKDKLSIDIHNLGQRLGYVSAGSSKIYYYDIDKKNYLIKDCASLGECFIYDNKFIEWQLTQETKIINGYEVFKATRNDGKVIAWYTPTIPVGFGPKGEYGLPGLILELEIGNTIFNAVKIKLNPKEKIKIEIPSGGKRVTYEEFKEIIKKAKKSVFGN